MIRFLDLKHQYYGIKAEIDKSIFDVIDKSAFINGEYVKKFEEEFAQYTNARHCIGVANGTDALEIAIEALDLPAFSEILVPANSFIASAEAVTRQGHKVVFVDANEYYTISIDDVKRKITKNTKAIIAVHLYGHPCDMDPICEIAREKELFIIEDCAQAHGAEYNGRKVGTIGDIATFSFYPGKNLGAYGDGGAITTNNSRFAKSCRMIANHGRIDKYDHEFEGRNSRLDGLQASILSVKLRHLPSWTNRRIAVADYYLEELKKIDKIHLPIRKDWAKQVYHLFVIRTKERDDLKLHLQNRGVQTGIHYPISLPKLKAYDYLAQEDDTAFANSCSSQLLSLPIGEHLNEADLKIVVDSIREFFT